MDACYRGTSKIAWGYLFLYLDVNLGTLNILPNWVAFLLIYQAIDLLEAEEPELALLRPFCLLLGGWEAVQWIYTFFTGQQLTLFLVSLLIRVISLYFHFQLLTNLASLAGRYQSQGADLDCRLLRLRTAQTVVITFHALLIDLFPRLLQRHEWLIIPSVLVGLILAIALTAALFSLRRCFSLKDSEAL